MAENSRETAKVLSPYEVLGVDKDADFETVKKAYRKLALKFHPDRASPETIHEVHERFLNIQQAFSALENFYGNGVGQQAEFQDGKIEVFLKVDAMTTDLNQHRYDFYKKQRILPVHLSATSGEQAFFDSLDFAEIARLIIAKNKEKNIPMQVGLTLKEGVAIVSEEKHDYEAIIVKVRLARELISSVKSSSQEKFPTYIYGVSQQKFCWTQRILEEGDIKPEDILSIYPMSISQIANVYAVDQAALALQWRAEEDVSHKPQSPFSDMVLSEPEQISDRTHLGYLNTLAFMKSEGPKIIEVWPAPFGEVLNPLCSSKMGTKRPVLGYHRDGSGKPLASSLFSDLELDKIRARKAELTQELQALFGFDKAKKVKLVDLLSALEEQRHDPNITKQELIDNLKTEYQHELQALFGQSRTMVLLNELLSLPTQSQSSILAISNNG